MGVSARRVEVEIGTLVVDKSAVTHSRELAEVIEREVVRASAYRVPGDHSGPARKQDAAETRVSMHAAAVGAAVAQVVERSLQ